MANDPKKDTRDAVHGLRPRLRPVLVAVGLNVLLAISLIGYPLYRGRTRAELTVEAYVAYAACLHAGTVRADPGLALPEHHRERFAALYVHAVPEWPASCRDELERIPMEPAFLLFPGAKTGEEEVRTAVLGARTALDAVADARASSSPPQIPQRLLRTLDHIAAAVSVLITETGVSIETEHLAFDLGEGASLVAPSRIPLQTASGGPLYVTARAGGFRAASADGRSASVVTVHDGVVDIVHVRRPSAARALIDDGRASYLGWVTGDATCAHDEAHCANRLTGLALVREGGEPSPEVWLAAHPALSLARSFALDHGALRIVAREADGGVSLRTFALPEPWPSAPAPDGQAPSIATTTELVGQIEDVVVVDGHAHGSHATQLVCGDRVIEILGERAGIGPHAGASGSALTFTIDAAVAPPIRGVDPLDDHARCAVSEAGGVSFAWLDRAGGLHLVADADAPTDQLVASELAGFAMTRTGETVIFATWGPDGRRQVTLRRVWHGRTLASDVAAACWDDGAGLCGPAGLATSGDDTILYAREEADLRVLRVLGSGAVAALPGLE